MTSAGAQSLADLRKAGCLEACIVTSGGAAALLWALHAAELQDLPIRYDINEALGKLAGDDNPDNSSTVRMQSIARRMKLACRLPLCHPQ